MKKSHKLALMISAFMFLSVSCSSTEDEPEVDSAAFGTITMNNTTTIATGENITFKATVTTNSTTYSTDAINWYADAASDVCTKSSVLNGESSFTTSYSSPGTYQLKCVYTYIVGTESLSLSKTYDNIVVKQAHVGNSLLGDSMESVIADNSSIFAVTGYADIMYQIDGDVTYYYYFTDNLLSSASSLEYKALTTDVEKAAYGYLMLQYTNTSQYIINKDKITYYVKYVDGYTPTTEESEAIAVFETGANITGTDEQTVLGAAVNSGNIALCFGSEIIDDSSVGYDAYVLYSSKYSKLMITTSVQEK